MSARWPVPEAASLGRLVEPAAWDVDLRGIGEGWEAQTHRARRLPHRRRAGARRDAGEGEARCCRQQSAHRWPIPRRVAGREERRPPFDTARLHPAHPQVPRPRAWAPASGRAAGRARCRVPRRGDEQRGQPPTGPGDATGRAQRRTAPRSDRDQPGRAGETPSGARPKALVWTPRRVQRWEEAVERLAALPADDPARTQLELAAQPPSAVMVWTPAQLGAFLDAAADDPLYALFHLISHRGLRRGEACGVGWTDVDLDAALRSPADRAIGVGDVGGHAEVRRR